VTEQQERTPDRKSVGWLRAFNFSVAQVELGLVPFIALFLQSSAQWSTSQVGAALAFGSVVQLLVQTPAGALIDRLKAKRWLLAAATGMVGLGCAALLVSTAAPLVWASQGVIGIARAVFPPAMAAITLGMFGKAGMDRQSGVSQGFNAAGSVFTALLLAAAGYYFGLPAMFYAVLGLCLATLLCLQRIRGGDIDFEAARGNEGHAAGDVKKPETPRGLRDIYRSLADLCRESAVRRFLLCAVLFYAADTAMVPLVTQILGKGEGTQRALLMTSSYIAVSQILFIVVAPLCGKLVGSIGRKPLLVFAFVALAGRAGLSAYADSPMVLLAAQCTDALSTGLFGLLGVLVISDFTRDKGNFNVAFAALSTVQGVGGVVSNALGGYLADSIGAAPTFMVLGGFAAAGVVIAMLVPETGKKPSGGSP